MEMYMLIVVVVTWIYNIFETYQNGTEMGVFYCV
jgi:hypothetical protein